MISTVSTYRVEKKAPHFTPKVWFPTGSTDRSIVFDLVENTPQGVQVVYDGVAITGFGSAPSTPSPPTTGDWPSYAVSVEPMDPKLIASTSAFRVTGPGLTHWNPAKAEFRLLDWPEKAVSRDINVLLMYNDGRVPGSMPDERRELSVLAAAKK